MAGLVSKVARRARREIVHSVATCRWRRDLRNRGFTIISQNCVGGCIYSDLGKEFLSPTVNLLIEGENFVKLISDLPRYLAVDAVAKGVCHAGGKEDCPLLEVGDLKIFALHYDSPEDAAAAWNRRRVRANLDNVFVVANTWNLGNNSAFVKKVCSCGYPTVVFSDEEWNDPRVVTLPGDIWMRDDRGIVRPNLTDWDEGGLRHFERFFDFVGWLNDQPDSPASYMA